MILDIEASKVSRGHARSKYRNRESQLEALEGLIRDFQLVHSAGSSEYGDRTPCTGKQLHKNFSRVWGKKKAKATASNDSPWQSEIADWNSNYIDTIRQACDELNIHESLPSYHPTIATPISPDFVVEDDDTTQASHGGEAVEGPSGDKDAADITTAHANVTDHEFGHSGDYNDSLHDACDPPRAGLIVRSPIILPPMPPPLESTPEAGLYLNKHADRLAKGLWDATVPHIKRLT